MPPDCSALDVACASACAEGRGRVGQSVRALEGQAVVPAQARTAPRALAWPERHQSSALRHAQQEWGHGACIQLMHIMQHT